MESNTSAIRGVPFLLPPSHFIRSLNLDPWSGLPGKGQTHRRIGVEKWKTLLQGNLGCNLSKIRIVCALREMGQHQVFGHAIKALANPVGHIFIGKMAEARKNPLLQFPGISITRLQHIPETEAADSFAP